VNKYKITPSGSNQSLEVEAESLFEVIDRVKSLGIAAKITKINAEAEVSGKWDRKFFPTRAEAVAHAKKAGCGTVKTQNGQFVWFALRG